ncbi:uncharacterized protein BDZ99DRAFT_475726 [Mytilinidion resinicola]|uniref:Uncharacterized protein n=1 Tax=Mytilinidion resinicola TaxID=574789 RepID=A0A6A6YPY7_9PEZI|nr:uncharacterized protein BDZ99DRAFT_475726 [Mytilinidion resinicola]KAF2810850.1 hypothetical protein BDZ99DRAFT_475726 [Mytilinidion resinicola]
MGRKERLAKARKAERRATEFNPPDWQPVSRPKPPKAPPLEEPPEEVPEPPEPPAPGFKDFLSLPRELRDMVYDDLITPNPAARLPHYPSPLHARSARARKHAKALRKEIREERGSKTNREYDTARFPHRSSNPCAPYTVDAAFFSESPTGVARALFLVDQQMRAEAEAVLYRKATFVNNCIACERHPYSVACSRRAAGRWHYAAGVPAIFDLDKPRDCKRFRRSDVRGWEERAAYVLAMPCLWWLRVDIGSALVGWEADIGEGGYHVRKGTLVVLARLVRALEERKAGGGREVEVELVSRFVEAMPRYDEGERNSVEQLVEEVKGVLREWELMACGCCFAKKKNGGVLESNFPAGSKNGILLMRAASA